MTRRLMIATGLVAMLFGATAWAHDDYRIIGTVVRVSAGKLDVRQTSSGKTISMLTDATTVVTRDKKKVPIAELKPGLNVVVDATGDSIDELEVVEVRIVPRPAAK